MTRRSAPLALALVVAAAAAAGCGGGSGAQTATGGSASAPPPANTADGGAADGTPTTAGSAPDSWHPIRAALEDAGFKVRKTARGGTPKPEAAFSVRAGGGRLVVVYAYASDEQAATVARSFRPLLRSNPDQVKVETVGHNLYVGTVEEPAVFPERALRRVIDAAEEP